LDNRNITEMSFDEIFPPLEPLSDTTKNSDDDIVYGSNPLTEDDSVHESYDTDCENHKTSSSDNPPPVFDAHIYQSAKMNAPAFVPPSSYEPLNPAVKQHQVNINTKNQSENYKNIIWGIMSIIFSSFGIGIIFAIVGLVKAKKDYQKQRETVGNTEQIQKPHVVIALCIIGIILNAVHLIPSIIDLILKLIYGG